MRETINSMRLYFFLVGGVTLLVNVAAISRAGTADISVIVVVSALLGLFGAAFFYAAITLKNAVMHARTNAIRVILYVNMAANVLAGLQSLAADTVRRNTEVIRIIIALAIGLYLLANLKRLVKNHAVPVGELAPASPPPVPATPDQADAQDTDAE
ncbi:MAG: hypothetical protein QGG42_22015 [Phycisphaerae bacterium]|jgi:hypothetical protein|nr:hypothetical protein [Phycisphaerae bacterium]